MNQILIRDSITFFLTVYKGTKGKKQQLCFVLAVFFYNQHPCFVQAVFFFVLCLKQLKLLDLGP